jgi:hypothetical protein
VWITCGPGWENGYDKHTFVENGTHAHMCVERLAVSHINPHH